MQAAASVASTAPYGPVVRHFIEQGYHRFEQPVDGDAAADLLTRLRAERRYDHSLFLSEAEFDADPQYRGVNPMPGRNLLDRFTDRLGFVEQNPEIVAAMTDLLGPDYRILNRKAVCGVPASAVPEWLKRRIAGNPVNNLGPYVRPEYRDVTYFYGIDFHQDLIDYQGRDADFITLYVYLHPVTRADAPLFLLEGSHRLGASVFPHDLTPSGPDTWLYRNGEAGETQTHQVVLTGGTGFAAMWHACTLHGTQPDAADHERISLRYLFSRAPEARTGIDVVNAALAGALSLEDTRVDLDDRGAAILKHNDVVKA